MQPLPKTPRSFCIYCRKNRGCNAKRPKKYKTQKNKNYQNLRE